MRGLSDEEPSAWDEPEYPDVFEVLERIESREALDEDFTYQNEEDYQ